MCSQTVTPTINASVTSGTALATIIDGNTDSDLTSNRGVARPGYAKAGTIWEDDSDPLLILRYYFDGTNDILLETVDTTNSTIISNVSPLRKNLLFNGDFRIWQWGTLKTWTTIDVFAADRFYNSMPATCTAEQVAGLVHEFGQRQTAVVAGFFDMGQKIEYSQSLVGKTVTVTAQVLISAAATLCECHIFSDLGSDGSVIITPTGALQTVSFTTTLTTAAVTGYWKFAVFGTLAIGEVLEIHEAQVEEGTQATDFEYRPISDEVASCKWYYQNLVYTTSSIITMSQATTGTNTIADINFEEMRIIPTFNTTGTVDTSISSGGPIPSTHNLAFPSVNNIRLDTVASGLVAGDASAIAAAAPGFTIHLDSEIY